MREKNFASAGDMETLVTEIASKYEKKANISQPTVITISNTNVKTEVGTAKTVTVTTNSGRNVSAESSDTSVATVGTASTTPGTVTVTITPVANGSCTITLSASAKTGYYAAKEYINVTVGSAIGIPTGGTAGQVLAKSSDTDYAVGWTTLKNSRVVELSETNIQTEVGTTKTVTVKYRVAGNSDTATYTSSDTSVATVAVTGHSSTGTSATDVITITPVANGDCTIKIAFANEVGYDAEYDYINVTVGAASGSSIKKTRYTITASSWSASANADGFYTYTVSLSPAVKSSPDVYVAGSTDSTQPTDAQRAQFGYVERCKVNGSTLTLYAKTKPTATFYVWVEGEEGTGSGDIVGNVVMPNSAGAGTLIPFNLTQNDRLENVFGGYMVNGDEVTIDLFAKVLVEPGETFVFPNLNKAPMDTRITGLPMPYKNVTAILSAYYYIYDSANNRYQTFANGAASVYKAQGTETYLAIIKYSDLNIAQRDVYIRIYDTYKKNN